MVVKGINFSLLLDRIEAALARTGERWLEFDTGEEIVKASEVVSTYADRPPKRSECTMRKTKDGIVVTLESLQLPKLDKQVHAEQVTAFQISALYQLASWLSDFEKRDGKD